MYNYKKYILSLFIFAGLFLGSGDLRNALYMAIQCSEAYHEFEIHMSDGCKIVAARNFLILQVIFSDSFDPSNATDLQYLWDLWYGFSVG